MTKRTDLSVNKTILSDLEILGASHDLHRRTHLQ